MKGERGNNRQGRRGRKKGGGAEKRVSGGGDPTWGGDGIVLVSMKFPNSLGEAIRPLKIELSLSNVSLRSAKPICSC